MLVRLVFVLQVLSFTQVWGNNNTYSPSRDCSVCRCKNWLGKNC